MYNEKREIIASRNRNKEISSESVHPVNLNGRAKIVDQCLHRIRSLAKEGLKTVITVPVFVAFKGYNRLSIEVHPDMYNYDPVFLVTSHGSLLDVPLGMVADQKRPRMIPMVRIEFMQNKFLKPFLKLWESIPVKRDGKDSAAVKSVVRNLKKGRSVCVAVEGTRTRTGHLGPIDEQAVDLVMLVSKLGYAVLPIGINGAYDTLPPGQKLPKPKKIIMRSGSKIDFSQCTDKQDYAKTLQSAIASVLEEKHKPLPNTPIMHSKADYLPKIDSLVNS